MEKVKHFSDNCELCNSTGVFLLDNKCKKCLGMDQEALDNKEQAKSALSNLISYVQANLQEAEMRMGVNLVKFSPMPREEKVSCKNTAHLAMIKHIQDSINKTKK